MIFFDQDYTVKRFTGASTLDPLTGDAIAATPQSLTISMNIQPLTGKALESVPEARRNSQNIYGFCDQELFTVRSGLQPDIIVYRGGEYEVYETAIYDNILDSHCEFKAALK